MDSTRLAQDEQDRDYSKGNCYYIALEFMKDSDGLKRDGALLANDKVELVHGLVRQIEHEPTSKMIRHAWVEISNEKVIDASNGNHDTALAADYYTRKEAIAVRRFSRQEADAIVSIQQKIGYWGEYTDADVAQCVANYDPSSSCFSQGTVFSRQIHK